MSGHPTLSEFDEGDSVRLDPAKADVSIGVVDDVRRDADGDVRSHAITISGDGVWDVEAQYDPRDGWTDPVAIERHYAGTKTRFVERGAAELEQINPGIHPEQLEPGITVEGVDKHRYRIVVAPWEREYDSKALAYDLDSGANVCERLDPEEVTGRVE